MSLVSGAFVFDCSFSLVVRRRLCVVGLSESRTILFISPLSTTTLTEHHPTLRVLLVGLVSLKRAGTGITLTASPLTFSDPS